LPCGIRVSSRDARRDLSYPLRNGPPAHSFARLTPHLRACTASYQRPLRRSCRASFSVAKSPGSTAVREENHRLPTHVGTVATPTSRYQSGSAYDATAMPQWDRPNLDTARQRSLISHSSTASYRVGRFRLPRGRCLQATWLTHSYFRFRHSNEPILRDAGAARSPNRWHANFTSTELWRTDLRPIVFRAGTRFRDHGRRTGSWTFANRNRTQGTTNAAPKERQCLGALLAYISRATVARNAVSGGSVFVKWRPRSALDIIEEDVIRSTVRPPHQIYDPLERSPGQPDRDPISEPRYASGRPFKIRRPIPLRTLESPRANCQYIRFRAI
jgi:hypothetical protein